MRTSFRRVSFASFLLLFTYAAAYAQGTRNPGPAEVLVDQEQYVSYWTMEANWHSELQLRNNSPSVDLTVTPSLRAADGSETALTPVTIKPQEVVSVPLHEALARVGSHPASEYGSVVLRYKAVSFRVLYVALMVHREARSIAFHIDGVGQLEGERDFLREGIWWLPNDKVSDYLILTNQGDALMPVKLTLYDAHGQSYEKTLSLAARQTARYSVRQLLEAGGLSGSYGGIEVHALAHARALDTLHFIFDEDAGFGAMLKMFDQDPLAKIEERDFAKQSAWVIRAPMLALAHPDPALALPAGTVLRPRLLLRNTTGENVSASIAFNWKSAAHTGQTVGPSLLLAPHETKRVDVSSLPASQRPPDDANWAAVIVTTTSKPDEVVAVAESYDATLRVGAQTPFSDQLASRWEGGEWQADALHDSITTVGNASAKPMKAGFTLFYNQGASRYDLEQTLAPNDQMWVDIGLLIRTGRPDIHGNVLPANLTTGSYQFRDVTNPVIGQLFEGKVIYDLTNGHVAYGCAVCCTFNGYLTYDPFGVGLNSSFTNGVMVKDNCGDPAEDGSGGFENWSTLNPAVAKTTLAGLHTGMSMGSTTSSTSGQLLWSNGRQGCLKRTVTPTGPTNVDHIFQIAYSAYIPVDHAQVAGDGCSYNGNAVDFIYMGDANRGTARAAEGISIFPAVSSASGYYGSCGQTRQYAYGSPANGSTLSSLDEDNISADCHLWNSSATASAAGFTHSETYSTNQGQELLVGSAGNPLETAAGPITWNMRVVISTANASTPTAYVNYNHTCYPAHQVAVNGSQVYLYTPRSNTFAYIAVCLSGTSTSKITGQTSPVSVPVQ